MMRNSGIPVVEIMDADGLPIDSMVGISHRRAGLEMAQAIQKQGYKNIGFMGTKCRWITVLVNVLRFY